MSSSNCKLVILLSGSGSNLQSFIDSVEAGSLKADIAAVFSNRPKAFGLERAANANIPTEAIDHTDFDSRDAFDAELMQRIDHYAPDLVILAGFMRIITQTFIDAFPERVINIHPALLPSFPGLNVQQQAIDYGARFSGCTVHFVDGGVDTGPIILQAVVPILPEDEAETLAARILEQEHKAYPRAIQLIAEGRVHVSGRQVSIVPACQTEPTSIINPALDG
jgi:phosphoribosylglycinamide formyltransferase-1